MNLPLVRNLKKLPQLFIFIGFFLLFFDISYYFMATMPGEKDYKCVIGASLTLPNILFSLFMSALVGIVVSGLIGFLFLQTKRKVMVSSVSGIGAVLGGLTVFCIPCTFPVISLFGLSISLNFFNSYNLLLRVASFLLLLLVAFLLNKKLAIDCERCRVV